MEKKKQRDRRILVTGATGYIGGRLVPRLLQEDYQVRAMTRDPARLQGRSWSNEIEIVQGDVLTPDTLPAAMDGISDAFYLIHSMGSGAEFAQRDLRAARNFGRAAAEAGVQSIIYLGGLGDPEAELSEHLQSRQATGDALRESGVPVTEFRAAIIVGSGSASFEMIRYLTERIPIMICPRWVYTRVQPIAIRDVLSYLTAVIERSESAGEIIEIGGADVLTYAQMLQVYAEERSLKRFLIPVPALTPGLSSHWVHWTTPIPARIARPLINGLRNEVVVRDDKARQIFPEIDPIPFRVAVQRSLRKLEAYEVETAWTDSLLSSLGDRKPVILTEREGMIVERRQRSVEAPPAHVFDTFSRLGGDQGWLAFDWAWWLRGVFDRMIGGVGFRRGRRHPQQLRVGDALDFWRIEEVVPGELLRLRAEMMVPGRAWLQFESKANDSGSSTYVQTAFFAPKGLLGLLYWYLLYPIHGPIFSSLADGVSRLAEETDPTGRPRTSPDHPSAKQNALRGKPTETMNTIERVQQRPQATAFVLALIAPFLAAFLGGIATSRSVSTWYNTLEKPRWNPPSWVFGPVWTALYTMMGVASWLVWRQGREDIESDSFATSVQAQGALKLYGVHLIVNALWSVIFFGMRRIGWAAAEIGVLWSLVTATTVRFYRIHPAAGWLMVPYLLWSTFASILNFVIWRKNRS